MSVRAISKFYHNDSVSEGCTGAPYPVELVSVCPDLDLAIAVFPAGTAASLGITSFPSLAPYGPAAGSAVLITTESTVRFALIMQLRTCPRR